MQLLPRIRTKYGENIGVEVFVSHPDLETEYSFVVSDIAAGVTTLTVDNGLKFANAEYLIIGRFGYEKSEIVKISGTPTATSITVSTTVHPHNRGEAIQFIPYNQITVERSTDAGTSYTPLSAIDIRPDSLETYLQRTADAATDYYRVRFYNSTTALYSAYSDGVIATGDVENSAGAVIRDALVSMGEEMDDKVFTKEFLLRVLDEGRDEMDLHENAGRWSFRTIFDYDAGDCIAGRYSLTLPTDLRDPETSKHILSVRLGKDAYPLTWLDKQEFNRWYQGVAHTTLDGSITTASTSLVLTSSGDFDESGSVDIAGEDITEEVDNAAYTTNTESTKTLGTVTSIANNHADDRDVWQGASFGTPTNYYVNNGIMYFNQPFEDSIAGESIYLDYYKKKSLLNSFGDLCDENFFPIYKYYLRFKIKLRKNPQMDVTQDFDYKKWVELREAQINKEFSGQHLRISVDIPR